MQSIGSLYFYSSIFHIKSLTELIDSSPPLRSMCCVSHEQNTLFVAFLLSKKVHTSGKKTLVLFLFVLAFEFAIALIQFLTIDFKFTF